MSNPLCGARAYWWDGEYEGECELTERHAGPHYDGVSWFNDDNERVEPPEPHNPETP